MQDTNYEEVAHTLAELIAGNLFAYMATSPEIDNRNKDMEFLSLFIIEHNEDLVELMIHLIRHTECEVTTLLYCLALIDKFLLKTGVYLNKCNVVLILLTSFILSLKFNEDEIVCIKTLGTQILKLPKGKLFRMELNFLEELDFQINIGKDTLGKYANAILNKNSG